jgi:group II intron reverse transcriptase/maturase
MNRKPFGIPKLLILDAWHQVKKAGGGAGIDNVSLKQYEENLSSNLYKLWNRMTSGTYFPQPVKQVAIPKAGGGMRNLGIPTVNDRIAQTVVRLSMEAELDKAFVPESFGSRPGKSAHQAIEQCRRNCWQYDWAVDIDLKAYFDTIDHQLLMKAVRKHARQNWEVLYIERWLKAPVQQVNGVIVAKGECGIPQGGSISPLLSNLFLHYGLDLWLKREFPRIPFERYLDDCIIHCKTKRQANFVVSRLKRRLDEIKLALNEEKTKICYCLDAKRRMHKEEPQVVFTFLGFDFKPRAMRRKTGGFALNFTPAVGRKAQKKLRDNLRKTGLARRTDITVEYLAATWSPIIRGWTNYFGQFRPSAMQWTLHLINRQIVGWLCRKYRLRTRAAQRRLLRTVQEKPNLFPHWALGVTR